ncbi:23S rRNA pseudouridine(2604) synthase RluF [Pseudoalteromonas sp. MMG010]|uniref:23S rRNA pseudouridine(2604) synthase RluF n=1 Tax=Pseudoalteromonas sp. MMG010 TaxID=2822685 RepID=UPI001B3A4928|nr:23S rRNA pseudouridine(2604) synthase RluF [Pseudoalteromonas sp. MMG010]MBQ4833440.1 23S rRNA pseudouridine(2604) synthase RluF [Pseudoalteromonas sp. MMG010]
MTELKRLNKFISETGFCSRREADKYIEQGRVTVNGQQPEMGVKVAPTDVVLVNGNPLKAVPKRVYIAYNKPVGVTCTTERKIQSNIVKAVNYPDRIFPIGRLDRPSEGLIFLTNEGDIVNKILRAGNNHEKEYLVSVDKPLNRQFVNKMASGIPILDTVTKKCKVTQTGPQQFKIVLTQGLNRQIRRMCEYLGYEVVTLKRTRIMNVTLKGLNVGKWRHLTESEMAQINDSIADSGKTQEHSVDSNKHVSDKTKPEKRNFQGENPRGFSRSSGTNEGGYKSGSKKRTAHYATKPGADSGNKTHQKSNKVSAKRAKPSGTLSLKK